MSPWPARLLVTAAVLFFAGWGLVLASGPWIVWEVGGLMVYASVPTFLVAAAWGVAALVRRVF